MKSTVSSCVLSGINKIGKFLFPDRLLFEESLRSLKDKVNLNFGSISLHCWLKHNFRASQFAHLKRGYKIFPE
jgi:hypothetical protein